MMKNLALLTIFLTLSLSAKKSEIVASVGSYNITNKMVALREKVAEIYYPDKKQKVGLIQLIKAYTTAQILENEGVKITQSDLKKEAKRIDENTKNTKILNQIKSIFGKKTESYYQVFILPNLAKRVIQPFVFKADKKFVQKGFKKADNFLQKCRTNLKKCSTFYHHPDYKVELLRYFTPLGEFYSENEKQQSVGSASVAVNPKTREERLAQEEVLKKLNAKTQKKKALNSSILIKLKKHELYPTIIELPNIWRILQYQKKIGQNYYFLSYTFKKPSFSEWYQEKKKKVKINRYI